MNRRLVFITGASSFIGQKLVQALTGRFPMRLLEHRKPIVVSHNQQIGEQLTRFLCKKALEGSHEERDINITPRSFLL